MRSRMIVAVFAGLTLSLGAFASTPSVTPYQTIPGASPEPIRQGAGLKGQQELETFIDGVMAGTLKAQHLAGATVSVVKEGKLYFAKGYGFADVAQQIPVDASTTLFRPGSVSKLLTWTALMQLVEQGKVDLDADVNTYITQFKLPSTFAQPIRVRNLLTHTPGLEDGIIGYGFVSGPDQLTPLAQTLAHHMPARVRPPATDFNDPNVSSYSNYGAALAGLIIENVSGMSFDDYLEKNIFGPLGMDSCTSREPLPAALKDHMSIGYRYKAGTFEALPFEWIHSIAPAGSISCSSTDIARFMIAHLNNGAYGDKRILSEETAKLMHSRQDSPSPYLPGACLGFYEEYINGRRLIAHAGDTGSFHSDLTLFPEENLGVFVSYNTASSFPISARHNLIVALMDRYYPARLPQVEAPKDFGQRATSFTGTYRLNRHSYTKNEKVISLPDAINVTATGQNTLLFNHGPLSWQMVEVRPNVFRKIDSDEMVAFDTDAAGRSTYLLNPIGLAFIDAYRAPWYDTPLFHYVVLAFGLLCCVVALVSLVRNWKRDRAVQTMARLARRLAAAVAAADFAFAVALAAAVVTLSDGVKPDWPRSFHTALVFPVIALPLTAAVVLLAVLAWRRRYWSLYGRIQYTFLGLGYAGFLWSLNYWNLIGFKFG